MVCSASVLLVRRGGRAVECGGLENRWSRKAPVGSNPTPSSHRSTALTAPLGMSWIA